MYRIVECIKSGDDYYEINNTTYKLNNYEYKQGDVVVADENAADGNSGTATVNNYYIMRYNLPKTGGFGAEKLVYAGFAIMIAGCICYIYLIKGKKGNDYNENEKGIIKEIVTLGLAVVTTLSMGIVASAADVTIKGPKNGHTYEVYQIFTGDVDSTNKLSNAKYGTVAKLTGSEK